MDGRNRRVMRWLGHAPLVAFAFAVLAFTAPAAWAVGSSSSSSGPDLAQVALLVTAIFGGIAAITGAIVTYLLGKRKTSGGVATSEAETIFQAAEKLREEQRAEVVALRAEVLSLRDEILSLRAEIGRLRAEAVQLRADAAQLRTENTAMRLESQVSMKRTEETAAALAAVQREMGIIRHGVQV